MTLPLFPGAPDPEPRVCLCGTPVPTGPLVHGWGSACARKHGLLPPAVPGPSQWQQDGPDLFDAARSDGNANDDQA